jgi:hypothetical protein
VIKTVDISKLLTRGDVGESSPIYCISRKLRWSISTNDALDLDENAPVSDIGASSSKQALGISTDTVFSRNRKLTEHDDSIPSSVIVDGINPLEARQAVGNFLRGRGYGVYASALSVYGFIASNEKVSFTASGLIGTSAASVTCNGTLALPSNQGLTETLNAAGSISNATYQVVDYLWGPDVTNEWYSSGDPSPFPGNELTVGDIVWLAIRIRLSEGAVMLGSDWSLYFKHPAGDWTRITAMTDTFKITDYSVAARDMPEDFSVYQIGWFHSVTRPGPGNPVTGYDIQVATQDDQSARVTSAAPVNAEVEVWYPLEISTPSIVTDFGDVIEFKILSENHSTRVIPGNSVTRAGWFNATIT